MGYTPSWGIGRHILGSQVFDYWRDPHGFEIEHWTDGDQLRASDGGGRAGMEAALGVQWGMQMPAPPRMAEYASVAGGGSNLPPFRSKVC
jgi:hypothetical protein